MPGSGRARWGWYRLADDVARALVAESRVGRGALVLDLGAGDGAITRHLLATGARTVAFELHPARAAHLRERFEATGLKVVRADIADLRLPTRDFHVVANPPFAVVSPVLRRLTHRHSRLVRADLVVPAAVASRWAACLQGTAWRLDVVRSVPRGAFTPRPTIDCCIVTITRTTHGASARQWARPTRRAGTSGGR